MQIIEEQLMAPIPCPECTVTPRVACMTCLDYGEVYSLGLYQDRALLQPFVRQATRESEFVWAWSTVGCHQRSSDQALLLSLFIDNPCTPLSILRHIHLRDGLLAPKLQETYEALETFEGAIQFFRRLIGPERHGKERSADIETVELFASYEMLNQQAIEVLLGYMHRWERWSSTPLLAFYRCARLGSKLLDESLFFTSRMNNAAYPSRSQRIEALLQSPAMQQLQQGDLEANAHASDIMKTLFRLVHQSCPKTVDALSLLLQNPILPVQMIREAIGLMKTMTDCMAKSAIREAILSSTATQLILLEDPGFASMLQESKPR